MKVYLNSKDPNQPRRIAIVDVIKECKTYFIVRLADGNTIKRKKNRDIPLEEGK
jgi:hypothetical protein